MKKNLFVFFIALSVHLINAQVQILAPMPGQTGTFTGNVRGYWFSSPTCFTITGLEVPTTASSGNQSIAVVRFQANPPTYSVTTDVFDVLYLTQDNPSPGIIPVNILINAGDIIGILGSRAGVCSYSNTGNVTIVDGFNINLSRLGMQFPLASTPPQQLWTEAASNISRVNFYYDSLMVYNLSYSNVGANYTFSDATDTLYTSLYSVWDYGDGSPLDTNYNPTHTYTTNGIFNVCSYVNTSCGIDTICTSVNVCIFPAESGFTSSVAGLDVTFTDTSNYSSAWLWDFGDGGTSTLQNPTHTYSGNGWYNIAQIVSNPCGPNDTIMDSVLICIPVTANYGSSNAADSSVQFTDLSTTATSWAWDFGDGGTSILQNPTHSYATNGTYTICLIASDVCSADTICTVITACPNNPSADFTGLSAVFNVSFTNNSASASSYLWNFGDGNTSTLANPSHTYAAAGSYNVCLTAYDDCGDSSVSCNMVNVLGNVGIEEIAEQHSLTAYPNPTQGVSNLTIQSPENIEGKLYITDMTGKIVNMIYAGEFLKGEAKFTINTSNWNVGLYLLVWETENWKTSRKLVVQ